MYLTLGHDYAGRGSDNAIHLISQTHRALDPKASVVSTYDSLQL
jgi:hypothetical protein